MRKYAEARCRKYAALLLVGVAVLAGCGGGGGGGSAGGGGVAASAGPSLQTLTSGTAIPVTNQANPPRNALTITVNRGPANTVNLPFASVTICVPGSSVQCQTIDGILVDTGSTGLRIQASVLAGLALPQQLDANGNPIAECAQFADGFTWGSVRIADVKIAGEHAAALPVQVIGDPAFPTIPIGCFSTGRSRSTVQTLGANGILGVSSFQHDCGSACATSASAGIYYVCGASGCRSVARPLAEQITNPVSRFADDNNGVIIELPAVPATGSAGVDGTLFFGIGTQPNNALGNASVFAINLLTGGITTFYKGAIIDHSIIDSGSNALFFADASIPVCSGGSAPGFDCPVSAQNLSATIQGMNGTNASVNFSVANADALLTTGFSAFSNLGAPMAAAFFATPSFDWGLPFFFGRRVFVALEGASVAGASSGPFVAF